MTLEAAANMKADMISADRIIISDDERRAMDRYFTDNKKNITEYNIKETLDHFPFRKFRLKIGPIDIYVELKDSKGLAILCAANNKLVKNLHYACFDEHDIFASNISKQHSADVIVSITVSAMHYILTQLENREKEIRLNVLSNRTQHCSPEHKKNNRAYLLNDLVQYIRTDNKPTQHHEYKCDCWGVRGHYRHYKSGKVVFIQSYQKGRNRDAERAPKTYVV